MSKRFAVIAGSLTLAAATAAAVAAQAPRIANARLVPQTAGSPFGDSFRTLAASQTDTAWIGYTVPLVEGDRTMCCGGSGSTYVSGSFVMREGRHCCATCRLEPSPQAGGVAPAVPPGGPIQLEAAEQMIVLFRVVDRRIERIRIFSADCELDAGGRSVIWLQNVRPSDSIALLESLVVASDKENRILDGAIPGIALHRDAAADAALERLAAAAQPDRVRRKVTFWLGNARGAPGLDLLRRILREDTSVEVRKSAVFGISQSPEPGASEALIDTARRHSHATVRGEAIFWLGQKAGAKAAAAITERIDQDPDTEVKKRAVFALSQMPKDEGVPLLIKVARSHDNPAVRKQAMFWLAQSKDPRAIDFFAEILK